MLWVWLYATLDIKLLFTSWWILFTSKPQHESMSVHGFIVVGPTWGHTDNATASSVA